MSDGDFGADKATPDASSELPRALGADGDEVGLAAATTGTRAAAPWERFGSSPQRVALAPRWSPPPTSAPPTSPLAELGADEDGGPTGCHTDGGLTVAELIAKIGGSTAARPRRHHAAPDPDLPEPDPEPPTDGHDDGYDAYAVSASPAYAYAVPDLEDVRPEPRVRGAAEQTTVLPKTPRRTRPAPIVDEPADDDILDEPADDDIRKQKPHRRRHAMMLFGRLMAAAIAALALALTGGAWQWSASKNHRLNTISALDPQSRDIVDPNAQYGDEDFLIVGMDSRAGANSDMGAGDTEDAGGARSDTVMLVNIPANRKRVVAVSFPRDLAITPIKCEAWNAETGAYGALYDDQTKSYGPEEVYTATKLNSAYAFGGPKGLVKVIQKLSGLSVNRFMAVDFAGFAKMVDAVGGVEVCSTTPLEDYELGTGLANAGRQVIDGHTALQYVRARQVTTESNGDYGRIKRQQLFLSSLLRSLISKEVFFSLSKLNNVVNMFIDDSYVDNIQTKDLVHLGQSLQGVNAGRITFVTVPTTGQTDSAGNEPPRTDDMHSLF